jgi:hypothetical protein
MLRMLSRSLCGKLSASGNLSASGKMSARSGALCVPRARAASGPGTRYKWEDLWESRSLCIPYVFTIGADRRAHTPLPPPPQNLPYARA